ncbi:hypothetical protein KA047_00930 [Candidatus Saccharibacteria bacterium]|nr:hypothetical protein [Candidatus Saccharibacteria bacterium]
MTHQPLCNKLDVYQPEVIANAAKETVAIRFNVAGLVTAEIGEDWQDQFRVVMNEAGETEIRMGDGHYTNREADPDATFELKSIPGHKLAQAVPGLWGLYQGVFKQMMQLALPVDVEPLRAYDEPEYGLECLSQRPTLPSDNTLNRMENHVDMRYTSILVVAAPASNTEGRLVIANNPNAQSVEEVLQDPIFISHRAGTVLCFSRGDVYPHFTEEMTTPGSERLVVSLNYPKASEAPGAAEELLDYRTSDDTGGRR